MIPVGPARVVREPLYVVPRWVSVLGLLLRGLWWLTVYAVKRPTTTALTVAVLYIGAVHGVEALAWTVGVTVVVLAVAAVLWWWLARPSFDRLVRYPVTGALRLRLVYRRRWFDTMRMCGLGKVVDHRTAVPTLRRVISTPATDRLVVRMLLGQNPEEYRKRALDLAYSFGARTAQVFEQRPDSRPERTGWCRWVWRKADDWRWADRPRDVHLVIVRTDVLAAPFGPLPTAADVDRDVDLAALPIARSFLGETYRFRLLASHLLIAGASQRGKGSVIWSLLAAMGPAIHTGLVRVLAVDPKGGMELAMGRALFHRFAYHTPADMADLLDEAVQVMRDRQARLQGKERAHTPSLAEPLYVVLVDELGALTRYMFDNELRKRIEAALGLLLSQGAGLGVLVVGALQDPRKETLDLRDLFLSRILLGVTADTHVDMVLGDGMRKRGAHADLLPASAKGVGWVLPDGSADPVKVRFPLHDDEAVQQLALRFAAPAPAGPLTGAVPAQTQASNVTALLPASLRTVFRPTGTTGEDR